MALIKVAKIYLGINIFTILSPAQMLLMPEKRTNVAAYGLLNLQLMKSSFNKIVK